MEWGCVTAIDSNVAVESGSGEAVLLFVEHQYSASDYKLFQVKKSALDGYVIGLLISGYYTRKNVDYYSMAFNHHIAIDCRSGPSAGSWPKGVHEQILSG